MFRFFAVKNADAQGFDFGPDITSNTVRNFLTQ